MAEPKAMTDVEIQGIKYELSDNGWLCVPSTLRIFGEIARLRKIVDALPTTADGVPIVPGMKVWRYAEDRGDALYFTTHAIHDCDDEAGKCDFRLGWDGYDPLPSQVYSTRAAALAEAERGGAKSE